jgi:hypothetical protein
MDNKIRFYNKEWFMWLTLVFIAPIGIFLLWKNGKVNPKIKPVLSIVSICLFLSALTANNKDTTNAVTPINNSSKQVINEPIETKNNEPKFDFTNADLTKENIQKAVEPVLKKGTLASVDYIIEKEKNIIDVFVDPGTTWDEKSLVKSNAVDAVAVMEILFKNPKVDKVWLWTKTDMTDPKGNTTKEDVVNVSLTKENAKDINWAKFKDMVYLDYNKLYNIADSFFIHPGIKKNLK